MEEQINRINGAITMLGNNQLRMLVFCLRIIIILTIKEGYDISILL